MTFVLLLALGGCPGSRPRTLVVHTPLDERLVEEVERRFEEAHPDVDVRMARRSGGRDAVPGEAGEQADVWWGAPAHALPGAAEDGLLSPVAPQWARGAPPADPQSRWHLLPEPVPLVLAFNVREVTRSRAPRDWRDLLHPQWTGQLVLLDPALNDAGRALVGALVLQELRRTGVEYAGFDFLGELDRITRAYAPDVRVALRRLRVGDGTLSVLPLDDVAEARAAGEDWLEYRVMQSGMPALARGVAVLAGTADPEAAAAFVELVGSEEVAGMRPPVDAPEDLRLWPTAPDTLAARLDDWLARWADEVRGRNRVIGP